MGGEQEWSIWGRSTAMETGMAGHREENPSRASPAYLWSVNLHPHELGNPINNSLAPGMQPNVRREGGT